MRATTVGTLASILLTLLLTLDVTAQDQGRQSPDRMAPPASAGTKAPQAPVGHRQPTERSLPPAVRKEEDAAAGKPPDPLGPIPSICKNC